MRHITTRLRAATTDDRGDTTILAAGLALILILAIGLVVDGGGKLQTDRQARWTAEQAARAAAQQIDFGAALGSGTAAADIAGASAAANATLAASGMTGTVTLTPDGNLEVTTTTTYRTVFLPLVGVREITATGTAVVDLTEGPH